MKKITRKPPRSRRRLLGGFSIAAWLVAFTDLALAAGLTVTVNDLVVERDVLAIPVLPGEIIDLAVMHAGHREVTATSDGEPFPLPDGRAEFLSPVTKGVHTLTFSAGDQSSTLHLLVMVPASEIVDGRLNGYRIGAYPLEPLKGLAVYQRPRGFIEVTQENRGTPVSPSYRLGEFVAKQKSDFPKYVVLRPRLLLKLELIADEIRRVKPDFRRFTIMSGYRTPYYNASIGNSRFSRHVYGGAADVYIDESPADGMMDDLNGDGRVDREDARWLWQLVDRMQRQGRFGELTGGLGLYGATASHGPFVHVDVRGFKARW